MAKPNAKQMEAAEAQIAKMIKELGPLYFVAAVNNSCAHGKAILDAGYKLDDDDAMLIRFFDGITMMRNAAKQIENFTKKQAKVAEPELKSKPRKPKEVSSMSVIADFVLKDK